jgi:hypothetical protein
MVTWILLYPLLRLVTHGGIIGYSESDMGVVIEHNEFAVLTVYLSKYEALLADFIFANSNHDQIF